MKYPIDTDLLKEAIPGKYTGNEAAEIFFQFHWGLVPFFTPYPIEDIKWQ